MESWISWAIAEGIVKSVSRNLQKLIGISAKSFESAIAFTFASGLIQLIAGIISTKGKIGTGTKFIIGGVISGIIASVATVIGTYAFIYQNADVGVYTFFVVLSIVPSVLVDRVFFGTKFYKRQWIGLFIFVLAGYSMLNFPSLRMLLNLPVWVWFAIMNGLLLVANEGVTRWLKEVNPMTHNFWVGLMTVLLTLSALLLIKWPWEIVFWSIALTNGMLVVIMILSKVMSYKREGSIVLKKFVMEAVQLSAATVMGIIFYQEQLHGGKLLGIAGYLIAFPLVSNSTWIHLSSIFCLKRK